LSTTTTRALWLRFNPRMDASPLPTPPIEPMLARIAEALPAEPGFLFEPKWDGFRAVVFRTATQTLLQSRDLKPLNRYFPELEQALHDALPKGCVIDGEIVVVSPHGLDFDALQQRIHPAASRVARLAEETPGAARRWTCPRRSVARGSSACSPARSRRCTSRR
jgi:ATP-dependent DNA ligase